MQNKGYEPVLGFMERYLLELDLCLDGRTPAQRMNIDKVVITKGSLALLHYVTPTTPFNITEIKRRIYSLQWNVNGKLVEINIPADCQLFIGSNAILLEEMMKRDLLRIKPVVEEFNLAKLKDKKLAKSTKDIYVSEGEYYLADAIKNSLYFVKIRNNMELVCSQRNTTISISNIMLTGVFRKVIPMELIIDKYGYKHDTLTISLQQFIDYCKLEYCEFYFGIKSIKNGVLTGTLFALNNKMAYNHVLAVEFPVSILYDKNDKIKATVYAYIPLQNVTEHFFTKNFKNEYKNEK
jgi:hypothetical protein